MDTFFCKEIQQGLCYLSPEESHHAARVLRKQVGASVRLMDGKGKIGVGVFEEVHKKTCVVRISELVEMQPSSYFLHIAIAPTKNLDRMEWFLEKSTELGLHQVTPILCKQSERKKIRLDRLEKVVKSATKQSMQAFVPQIDDLTPYTPFLQSLAAKYTQRFIAYCGDGPTKDLSHVLEQGEQTIVLIGPEGDFTLEEYELALSHGFVGLKLGESRLRTETAGIYVAAAYRTANS